jgi:hypothetical protein
MRAGAILPVRCMFRIKNGVDVVGPVLEKVDARKILSTVGA